MNRVTDSPIPEMDFESEISQQLDKIAETGKIFCDQILDLGKKLKSFQEAEGQNNQKLQHDSSDTSKDWIKAIESKMQKATIVQQQMSATIRDLERRRFNLHELVAEKVEDVLKDVAMLKSLTETTRALKKTPKLEEERKTTRELESQIDKMTQDLKGKLDLLESARKSNQNAIELSLEKFGFPTLTELIDADGWIVIQRRDSGPQDEFERGWTDYENGFGYIYGNFWLGLKKIYELTADGSKELRVELTDWDGNFGYANYSEFAVSNAADFYRLSVGGYSGNAGNSLQCSNGSQFSTMDKKNGGCTDLNGGWWKLGGNDNLNGLYYEEKKAKSKGGQDYGGVYWWTWKNTDYSLQKVLMKIRQRK